MTSIKSLKKDIPSNIPINLSHLSYKMTKSSTSDNPIVYHSSHFDILRLEVPNWEEQSPQDRLYLYHLSRSCLYGRDIIYLQNHRYGLIVREILEALYENPSTRTPELEDYLTQYWFHSGAHHNYEETKFEPRFSVEWFEEAVSLLPYDVDAYLQAFGIEFDTIKKYLFDKDYEGKRRASGDPSTLIERSSVNFYAPDITTKEAENYYKTQSKRFSIAPGLNSYLYRESSTGIIREVVASSSGLYGEAIQNIVTELQLASQYAPSENSREVLEKLISYYSSGDIEDFADYSKSWINLRDHIDMINGFIETYTDPLGLKGSWEGIVELEDQEGTKRTSKIISLAEKFEADSPIDPLFMRDRVGAVSNRAINVVTLSGDSYPASPLGINLPNDERLRAEEGSKSVTLSNISSAINRAGSSRTIPTYFYGEEVQERQKKYGETADTLHTDLHEGIGHASGKLLAGVRGDALREFDSVIEETRADLNALYFIAHPLLRSEGIISTTEVYKALYDGYLTRGVLSQLARVGEEPILKQAHMQNRALIGWWTLHLAREDGAVKLEKKADGKHYISIYNYDRIREIFGIELQEIQRIKSTGDYSAAKELVERYGTKVDLELLEEIKKRDKEMGIPPYVGFVNPILHLDDSGEVRLILGEDFITQNLRYSKEYRTLAEPLARKKKTLTLDEGEWKPVMDTIRTKLRRLMDGKVSSSMKSNGVNWRLNYGANLIRLKELAKELPKDIELSRLLRAYEIREMRLLAMMVMPLSVDHSEVIRMSREIKTVEEVEQLVDNILIPMGISDEILEEAGGSNTGYLSSIVPFVLFSKLISTGQYTEAIPIKKLVDLSLRRLSESSNPLVAINIHRTFTKIAEGRPELREEVVSFSRLLVAEFSAGSLAHAIGEDLEELVRFLEEEERQ